MGSRRPMKSFGHIIGLYPETKHPTYFDRLGLSLEEPLVKVLHRNGYEGRHTRVFIQSFEINNLRKLKSMTRIPLVQLLWIESKPFDVEAEGGTLTYERMATPAGSAQIPHMPKGWVLKSASSFPSTLREPQSPPAPHSLFSMPMQWDSGASVYLLLRERLSADQFQVVQRSQRPG